MLPVRAAALWWYRKTTGTTSARSRSSPFRPKVHSLDIDPETHRVYASEEEEDGKPTARMVVYEAVIPPAQAIR
jgi:hypothetical protein